jgi:UDP-N-acetylmuramyl pentapeptide phosphotransferase/UDP-N-acetylglucosamine-1-phosphate transferase
VPLLALIIAFGIVVFAMPTLIQVAKLKHLVDAPGDVRKIHKRSVPTIGGVVVVFGFLFSALLILPSLTFSEGGSFDARWLYMMGAAFALFYVGLKDDLIGLSPAKKLLVHLVLGTLLLWGGGFRIETFGGLFGIHELPLLISYPFSLFVYIVVVNAINLIDGIDGLAGGYGALAFGAFGAFFWFTDNPAPAILAIAFAGSLLGFLVYNFHPARIFMGDCGSLVLGLVAYTFASELLNTPEHHLPLAFSGISLPVLGMSLLAYPLVDTLRVFTLRAMDGRSPFSPDKNHLHHRLIMAGYGHRGASIILYVYSIGFMALPVLVYLMVPELDQNLLFISELVLAFIAFVPLLRKTHFAHKREEVRTQQIDSTQETAPKPSKKARQKSSVRHSSIRAESVGI